MTALFISYRRSDSQQQADKVRTRLEAEFGADAVFMDRSIIPGKEFPVVLKEALAKCEVLLAVIGPTWATIAEVNGVRRLHNPRDFVRIEIETALHRTDRKVHVVPVLVGGVKSADLYAHGWRLPETLVALRDRQAAVLSDATFDDDVTTLVQRLKDLLMTGAVELQEEASVDAASAESGMPAEFDQEFGNAMAEYAMGNRQ
jgi:hypothetical protein